MATSVTFNGSTYSIPANREPRGWGTSLSSFLVDVANSSLSKAGGNFTLTADANFGSNYGLVVKYIKSVSSNIAASGVVRLANNEGIGWRNAANGADKVLKLDAGDRLEIDGVDIVTVSSTDTLTNKTLTSPAINTPTGIVKGDVGLGNVDNTSDADKPVSSTQQAALDLKADLASPTLVTPTIDDYLILNEESSPGTAGAGTVRIYAKTDKKIYKKDSNGTESELGAGGTSAINYISNYDFETGATTGWATYDDGASATPVDGTGGSPATLTLSANSSSPMRGSYDFKIVKSAADSQGEGFSYDFTVKSPDTSKKLSISFDLNSNDANYTAGDVVVYVYDVTNATLITPSSTSLPKLDKRNHTITFDSTTSTSYRLIFHWAVTTATAVSLYLDTIVVGPGTVVQGAAVSEWQSFTPTFNNLTVTNNGSFYRRVGSSIEMMIDVTASGDATGQVQWNLVGGLTGITANTSGFGSRQVFGSGNLVCATNHYVVAPMYSGTATYAFFRLDSTSALLDASNPTADGGVDSTDRLTFTAKFPVSEWAGNGTVNLGAGAQVEYAYTSDTWNGTGSTTAYGPAGQIMAGALGAARQKTVTWQYPVQTDDLIIVEGSTDRLTWTPIVGSQLGAGQNSVINTMDSAGNLGAGVLVRSTTTTTTVTFGRYMNMANDDSPVVDWPSDAYWRVRKAKASSPVGFGMAGTDGSAGLVNPYTEGSGVVYTGQFTPMATNTTNVSASSPGLATYMRVGKVVHVTGSVDVTCTTAANTSSLIELTIPIVSNFTLSSDLRGIGTRDAASGTAMAPCYLSANTGSDRAYISFNCTTTANSTLTYQYQYIIK